MKNNDILRTSVKFKKWTDEIISVKNEKRSFPFQWHMDDVSSSSAKSS